MSVPNRKPVQPIHALKTNSIKRRLQWLWFVRVAANVRDSDANTEIMNNTEWKSSQLASTRDSRATAIQCLQTVMEFPPKIPHLNDTYSPLLPIHRLIEYCLPVLILAVDEEWVHNLILSDLHRGLHPWVSWCLHNSHSINKGDWLSWLGICYTPKQSKGSYQTLEWHRKQITNCGNLFDQGLSATICLEKPPSRIEEMDQTRNKDLFVIQACVKTLGKKLQHAFQNTLRLKQVNGIDLSADFLQCTHS